LVRRLPPPGILAGAVAVWQCRGRRDGCGGIGGAFARGGRGGVRGFCGCGVQEAPQIPLGRCHGGQASVNGGMGNRSWRESNSDDGIFFSFVLAKVEECRLPNACQREIM
jgi:hypothetical protein